MIRKVFVAIYMTLIWPLLVIDWRMIGAGDWRLAVKWANGDVFLAWRDCREKPTGKKRGN